MELARTFDTVAAAYDAERSGYPARLFDDLLAGTGLTGGRRVLEVGCGSGQATIGLLERGLHVTAIDPGPALVELARQRLSGWKALSLNISTFEDWPISTGRFDLVVSAQAWHWIDPNISYPKAADVLTDGGWLAIFGHTPAWSDILLAELEPVYRALAPELWRAPPESWYLSEGPVSDLIRSSGRFETPFHRSYEWAREFTPTSFAAYLGTRSDHNVLPADRRRSLLAGVEQALSDKVSARWATNLYLARRA